MQKHREIEYRVLQGVEPRTWKWEIFLPDGTKAGQSLSKLQAVRTAERAIEKAIGAKRRLPPDAQQ